MIRLRQWEVVRYFLDVAWAMVMEVGFYEIRRGRLPPVAGRIHHLVAGFVAGLRHPANPATLVFRPMPGPEVSERRAGPTTIVVEPSDYVLRNAGDMAMMQVAMTRLADLSRTPTSRCSRTSPTTLDPGAQRAGRRCDGAPVVVAHAVGARSCRAARACVGGPLAPAGGCATVAAPGAAGRACASTPTGGRASVTTSRCWPGPTSCWPPAWGA